MVNHINYYIFDKVRVRLCRFSKIFTFLFFAKGVESKSLLSFFQIDQNTPMTKALLTIFIT